MSNTNTIAKLTSLTLAEAAEVEQIIMEEDLLDWSEAAPAQIEQAIDEAHTMWLHGGADEYWAYLEEHFALPRYYTA